MLTAYTLIDRICAHSTNAAHGMEVPRNARLLFCNGQVGARLDGTIPEDPADQIEVIFERIRILLAAAGMTFRESSNSPSTSRTSLSWTTISAYAGASWATIIRRPRF